MRCEPYLWRCMLPVIVVLDLSGTPCRRGMSWEGKNRGAHKIGGHMLCDTVSFLSRGTNTSLLARRRQDSTTLTPFHIHTCNGDETELTTPFFLPRTISSLWKVYMDGWVADGLNEVCMRLSRTASWVQPLADSSRISSDSAISLGLLWLVRTSLARKNRRKHY